MSGRNLEGRTGLGEDKGVAGLGNCDGAGLRKSRGHEGDNG